MDYSVIIPVYNEEDSVVATYGAIMKTMDQMQGSYEIVFVDDGSTDGSLIKLRELQKQFKQITLVSLKGHAGQAEALQAGFDCAFGEIYITMDADGQNDPQDIPKLLNKLSQGYDIVYGWRYERRDNYNKKVAAGLAYLIRQVLLQDRIHDVGCALRVFHKKTIQGVRLSKGLHRYFSYIMWKKGYRIAEVKVIGLARQKGVSKYGFWDRFLEGAADLFRIIFIDINKLVSCKSRHKIKEIFRSPV